LLAETEVKYVVECRLRCGMSKSEKK